MGNVQNDLFVGSNSFVEYNDVGEVTVIGLSHDKRFLTVGGRKEHRVLKIEQGSGGRYTKMETVATVRTRNRSSLEYGIHDVKWNPSRYPNFL